VLNKLEEFYLRHDEPVNGTLQALRKIILHMNGNITESWKYSMPFFCYHGKMFCFLWTEKKNGRPYIGLV
jgi:hypothetical protein